MTITIHEHVGGETYRGTDETGRRDTYKVIDLARAESKGTTVMWTNALEPAGYRERVRHFNEPHR